MPSPQMRAVAVFLRLTAKNRMSTAERAQRRITAPKGSTEPPAAVRRRHDVTSREVGGFRCHTVAPRGRQSDRAAVYLHGGAYYSELAPQHWALVSRLADAGVRVRVVADACAGASRADHERALAAMALYAPLIEITTSDAVLATVRP